MPKCCSFLLILALTGCLFQNAVYSQSQLDKNKLLINTYQTADSLYLNSQNHAALDTLLEILPYIEQCNDTLQSKVLGLFGYLHRQIGSDTVSLKNFIKAIPREKFNKYLSSVRALSNYFLNRGSYKKALNYAQKLILFSMEANDSLQLANGYFITANVFQITGNLTKSKHYIKEALKLYKSEKHQISTIQALSMIGEIYKTEHQIDSATYYFRETIKLARTQDSPSIRSLAYHRIALVMLENKHFNEGFRYMNNALSISKQNNLPTTSSIYFDLAQYKQKSGDQTQALNYYLLATEYATQAENLNTKSKAMRNAAKIYLNQNKYQKAAILYEKSLLINDQLQKEANIKITSQMEARYNLLQKEQQIELLDRDKKIREIELDHQDTRNNLMLLALSFMIILIGILIYHIFMRQKQNRTLADQNQQINDQNEELNQINRQLSESEEKLIQALSTKDRLFAIIGHDLKSPLMNLKNLLFVLKSNPGQLSPEKISEHSNEIDNALTSLLELLNNLLNWSLAENAIIQFRPEKCNLSELVLDSINLFKGQLHNKNIVLTKNLPEKLIFYTDKNMFDFISRNLISNALKFSNLGGKIDVSITDKADHIEFIIKDYGIGMDDEEIRNLFSLQPQRTNKGTHKERGTGLGLKVSHDFIKQMGGYIYIKSNKGTGTNVTVILSKKTD